MSPCRRAGLTSLALHAAGVVALVAAATPRAVPVGVGPTPDSRPACEIGVVTLDETPTPVAVAPQPLPAVPDVPPTPPVPQPEPIRAVAYAEPPPLPAARWTLPAEPAAPVVPTVRNAPAVSHGHQAPLQPVAAGPRRIAFCGIAATGSTVVYVIDRSASMGLDGRFDRARRAVAASLRQLPPAARFQVIAYHRTAAMLSQATGLIAATPTAVEAAIAHLDSLAAEGGNGHRAALLLALSLRPDAVYYLTDDDELTAEDVREVSRLNRGKASIHALCLVPARGDSPLRQLAAANRGVFQVVAP